MSFQFNTSLTLPPLSFGQSAACEVDDDCSLKAFGCFDHHDNPLMKQVTSYMNHMIELNYIKCDLSGMKFTQAGLDYMWSKQKDFIDHNLDKLDFSNFPQAQGLINQLKDAENKGKSNINTIEKFQKTNLLVNDPLENEIDCNEMKFKEKNKECPEIWD